MNCLSFSSLITRRIWGPKRGTCPKRCVRLAMLSFTQEPGSARYRCFQFLTSCTALLMKDINMLLMFARLLPSRITAGLTECGLSCRRGALSGEWVSERFQRLRLSSWCPLSCRMKKSLTNFLSFWQALGPQWCGTDSDSHVYPDVAQSQNGECLKNRSLLFSAQLFYFSLRVSQFNSVYLYSTFINGHCFRNIKIYQFRI